MFQKIIQACVKMVNRWLPDPFIFAIVLTLIIAIVAMPVCHQTPIDVITNWGGGIMGLLKFAMQMALVLVCGSTLASAPLVKNGISRLAAIPKTPAAAIALVTFVSALCCWLNWGFGLIVGVIFAKEIARQMPRIDYRLLIASAYSGFVVWHAGLSGSIPLKMASDADELAAVTHGALTDVVPISRTLLDPHNIVMVLVVMVAITAVNALMHPKGNDVVTVDASLLADDPAPKRVKGSTPAERLEQSPILSWLIALMGLSYLIIHLAVQHAAFDLDACIVIFLVFGILFHGTPMAYVKAFGTAAKGAAGIILQFPFYAGIMGIITGVGTGADAQSLGEVLSNGCVAISSAHTYPLLTFLCAAVLNLFVPSGGGHWAIQAPIMFSAGANLGVDPGLTGIAIAWGDAWTNLIQPFWALPALAIAKLDAKDIMGYCLIDLVVTGIIICGGLLIWAF